MTKRSTTLSLVAASALLALTACGGSSNPGQSHQREPDAPTPTTGHEHATQKSTASTHAARPRGSKPTHVDTDKAESVAEAYATIVNSYDTKLDKIPFAAEQRARRLLTPERRKQLSTVTPNPQTNGTWWNRMARHDGYTTVKLIRNLDTGPKDSSDSVARSFLVTRTPHNDHGWTGKSDRRVLYLTLVHSNGAWKISNVKAQPAQ